MRHYYYLWIFTKSPVCSFLNFNLSQLAVVCSHFCSVAIMDHFLFIPFFFFLFVRSLHLVDFYEWVSGNVFVSTFSEYHVHIHYFFLLLLYHCLPLLTLSYCQLCPFTAVFAINVLMLCWFWCHFPPHRML